MKKPVVIFSLVVVFAIAAVGGYAVLSKKMNQNQKEEQPVPPTFSNNQAFSTFETDAFKMTYPKWTPIHFDTKAPDADKIKVAVSNKEGCSFFLKVKDLPEKETLQTYTDQVVKALGDRITVKTSEVKDGKAFLDAEIKMDGGAVMRNVSRVFQSGKTIYSVAFLAEKNAFTNACEPVLNEVVESVKVE